MRYVLLIIAFSFISLIFQGQSCQKFHESGICGPVVTKEGFKMFGQSKSAMFEINQTSKFLVTFYGEKDYKVICGTEAGYEPVRMRIIDQSDGKVFYDNSEDDYNESIGFSIEKTQQLIVEVTLLAENYQPEDFEENRACIGILILWKRTPQLGFTEKEQ
jgi:hypothetical protein